MTKSRVFLFLHARSAGPRFIVGGLSRSRETDARAVLAFAAARLAVVVSRRRAQYPSRTGATAAGASNSRVRASAAWLVLRQHLPHLFETEAAWGLLS